MARVTNLLLVTAGGMLGMAVLVSGRQSLRLDRSPEMVLTGTVTSASGEPMSGVTVSARRSSEPVTTSVFTDREGKYYFPAMQDGTYSMWAQAVGSEGV